MCPRGRFQGGPRGRAYFGIARSRFAGAPLCFGSGASFVARRESGAGPSFRGGAAIRPKTALSCSRLVSAGSSQGTPRGRTYFRYLSDSRTWCPVGFRQWCVASSALGGSGLGYRFPGEWAGLNPRCVAAARYALAPMVLGERRTAKSDLGTTWRPSSGNPTAPLTTYVWRCQITF